MVDIAVCLIIVFFALVGLYKGFWQYFLELIITAIALGLGWIYYQQRHEILSAFVVFIWVFFGLWIFKWFLRRVMKKKERATSQSLFTNRILGAAIGSVWGIIITASLIFSINLLPSELIFGGELKKHAQNSSSWQLFQQYLPVKDIAIVENLSYMSQIADNQNAQLELFKQEKFQDILQHESFKRVMDDPQTLEQLKTKDLKKLLRNPRIINLLNDGNFIEKLLSLDFKQAVENAQ